MGGFYPGSPLRRQLAPRLAAPHFAAMYPWIRFALVTAAARRRPALELDGVSELNLTCMPWDIDMFGELNNGRTLTFYDLGRFDQTIRSGFVGLMRRRGWTVTLGGATVRWRRRVTMFDRLVLKTQPLCRDARWVYFQQSLERDGTAVSAALLRSCAVRNRRIVPTDEVAEAIGRPDWRPPMPDWIAEWIAGEDARDWPPVFQ